MDWLTALKSFNRVVQHNSFSAAAKGRYASASALSKHVAWLEAQTGTRLLQRTTRHLSVTEAGQLLHHKSLQLIEDLDHIQNTLSARQNKITGTLTITAPINLGQILFKDNIILFMQQYPDLKINLMLDNQYHDLIQEGIDIAIRQNKTDEKYLVCKPIVHSKHGFYASKKYLSSHRPINTPADIIHHSCLAHADLSPPQLWRFKKEIVTVDPILISNNSNLLINAAKGDLGIIHIPEYALPAAQDQSKNDMLIPVLPKQWTDPTTFYLTYMRQHDNKEKIASFVRFIEEKIQLSVK